MAPGKTVYYNGELSGLRRQLAWSQPIKWDCSDVCKFLRKPNELAI